MEIILSLVELFPELSFVVLTVFVALIALAFWFRRRGHVGRQISWVILCLTIVIAAVFSFEAYKKTYPLESFYKEEFVKVTGLDFPSSGQFLFKEASYPAFNGDYESCALIEVSMEDYMKLRSNIQKYHPAPNPISSSCMDNLTLFLGDVSLLAEYFYHDTRKTKDVYWALVAEKPLVVFSYFQW
jgi:hypothetical protein